ncbi:MAG: glycine cleavage system aminomethyltransferase GcvT [Phycisphaerae bacterium]|nr:glycine cleavage system aminomethyltransferase GcvT [Phycisphaerae bacterium]
MLQTPLHRFHLDHGAKMVEFAGWEMPLVYTSLTEEHRQTRTSGGLFDVSHMGRLRVTGRHARRLLERACTRRIHDMQSGQCRYSLVCNPRGGVMDDVIVYRVDDDEFIVVVNASNREKIVGHLAQVQGGKFHGDGELMARVDDQTARTAMVALQGPKVMEFIASFSKEIPTLKRYRFAVKNLLIAKLYVSRTGYTGEDGVEAILPADMVPMAMTLLLRGMDLKAPGSLIRPCGLGARDTLRIEAGMPLYGHELGEEIDALSCGVGFAISLDKAAGEHAERFVGMDALEKTKASGGPARELVGLAIEGKRSARQGMGVRHAGRGVGTVTSGCPSPTLGRCIAMAFVDKDLASAGTALSVDTGKGETLPARVVPLPFYKAGK